MVVVSAFMESLKDMAVKKIQETKHFQEESVF